MTGNGRDGYIASNNGGFTISHQVAHQIHPGTIYYPQNDVLFKTVSKSKRVFGVSQPKTSNVCPIKYHPSGSGRDTYIASNNGGFTVHNGSVKFCGL